MRSLLEAQYMEGNRANNNSILFAKIDDYMGFITFFTLLDQRFTIISLDDVVHMVA